MDGFCIDYGKVTLVVGVLNIIIDFAMLLCPLPELWKLQMPKSRKIGVSAIFVLGALYV